MHAMLRICASYSYVMLYDWFLRCFAATASFWCSICQFFILYCLSLVFQLYELKITNYMLICLEMLHETSSDVEVRILILDRVFILRFFLQIFDVANILSWCYGEAFEEIFPLDFRMLAAPKKSYGAKHAILVWNLDWYSLVRRYNCTRKGCWNKPLLRYQFSPSLEEATFYSLTRVEMD